MIILFSSVTIKIYRWHWMVVSLSFQICKSYKTPVEHNHWHLPFRHFWFNLQIKLPILHTQLLCFLPDGLDTQSTTLRLRTGENQVSAYTRVWVKTIKKIKLHKQILTILFSHIWCVEDEASSHWTGSHHWHTWPLPACNTEGGTQNCQLARTLGPDPRLCTLHAKKQLWNNELK